MSSLATTRFVSCAFSELDMPAPPDFVRDGELGATILTCQGHRGMRLRVYGSHDSAPENKTAKIELWAFEESGKYKHFRPWLFGTIVATLIKRVREDHEQIPVVNLAYDGQAEGNLLTRIEAFMHQVKEFHDRGRRRGARTTVDIAAG